MSEPSVTIIIVNYNSGDRLAACLDHLNAQSDQDFQVIVIDNASSDGSQSAAKARDRVTLMSSPSNLGFAAGNNAAVKAATSPWLAFLNPDAYPAPDWIKQFKRAREKYPEIKAFGSTQIDAAHRDTLDGVGDVCHGFGLYYRGGFGAAVTSTPPDGYVFSPCAAAAFYRRDIFNALGGFDERFFCYGEDIDLGFRLIHAGERAIQLHDAIVYHEGSGVTGRRSDFSIYHGVRNRLWVFRKNLPDTVYYTLLPLHAVVNLAMLVKSVVAGEGRAYWRGLRDGLASMKEMRRAGRNILSKSTLSSADLLQLLTWSPLRLLRRSADVRKL